MNYLYQHDSTDANYNTMSTTTSDKFVFVTNITRSRTDSTVNDETPANVDLITDKISQQVQREYQIVMVYGLMHLIHIA